ncbi:uncharacterized protein LOC105184527 [Harpegnathos saltator]|uniref:tRNA-splicing endonuclease subunit Sen54 n=1 Tax=Harpegnathos saltator TaxID=610380 RepID=E2BMM8_HARSA|nr:uncharacterized protein LOC105184527 [Harpegnathos saltator]EFN83046.1 tRNA-splicing endonuclease subunit Sen54 [Harpegnathos saltator]
MDDICKKLPSNVLKAEELLRSKGISTNVLEEWEKSLQALPKSGKKHFEPNNSWLENVQIEKGLKTRRNLLNIERVERVSELASAEWIPSQKKALVTKKSGQDWSSFGIDKNGSLYLIPEEALFLLETNCLELIWNGVPCSIQQAYEILIDDEVCTLDEYRVYSQLTRCGYRMQRYVYEESVKNDKSDDSSVKKKVIVDPENGLRMYDSQTPNQQISERLKETLEKDASQTIDLSVTMPNTKDCSDTVEQAILDVMDYILCNIEEGENNLATSQLTESNKKQKSDMDGEEKGQNSKLEIISDEILLGSIKILTDTTSSPKKESVTPSKWLGARIQRNVKLLPKRSNKVSHVEISVIGSSSTSGKLRNHGKRKTVATTNESSDTKKSKDEVIELSDDEIQELPHTMTRMEMLNLLPNIAYKSTMKKISTRYIPRNVKPQRNIYQYNQAQLSHMQQNDRQARQKCKGIGNNSNQNAFRSNASSSTNLRAVVGNNRSSAYPNQHTRPLLCNPPRPFHPINHLMHGPHIGFPYAYHGFPFGCNQGVYALQNRLTLMQQNVFQNMLVAFENHGNAVQQTRSLTIQMNNFAMPFTGLYRTRCPENQYSRQAVYRNFPSQQRTFCQRRPENASTMQSNAHFIGKRRCENVKKNNNREITNRPSFTIHPGVSSWAELKQKWCEEKTITIDDEDCKSRNESGEEVQVVEQFVKPLVGPRHATSLAEVCNKLAIIKSAPEKTFRRKKSKYKISYNVYSCSHHYKKSNPGQPLYSVVVIRKENSFLQPVELNRLQQDAKGSQIILACVSMSISYIQPGIITMPNII